MNIARISIMMVTKKKVAVQDKVGLNEKTMRLATGSENGKRLGPDNHRSIVEVAKKNKYKFQCEN